jgi:hypothetical protein
MLHLPGTDANEWLSVQGSMSAEIPYILLQRLNPLAEGEKAVYKGSQPTWTPEQRATRWRQYPEDGASVPGADERTTRLQYVIPDGIDCDHCVLHWYWQSLNNWQDDDATSTGTTAGERFWNCADIQVTSSGNSVTGPTNPSPTNPAPTNPTPTPQPIQSGQPTSQPFQPTPFTPVNPSCGTCNGCLWVQHNACYTTWDESVCARYSNEGYQWCGSGSGGSPTETPPTTNPPTNPSPTTTPPTTIKHKASTQICVLVC